MPYETVTLQEKGHVMIINVIGLESDRMKVDQLSDELSALIIVSANMLRQRIEGGNRGPGAVAVF